VKGAPIFPRVHTFAIHEALRLQRKTTCASADLFVKRTAKKVTSGFLQHVQCDAWMEGLAIQHASTRTPTWLKVPV
jgi:hypothetical protein